jgi:hypothetical protein
MRSSWIAAAAAFAVSCLLAGCDSGDTSTVTPAETQAAVDATKKWQESHSKPAGPIGGSSSAADALKKKHVPR